MSDPSSYNFDSDGYRMLFLDWLKEWKTEAATTQSKIQYTYANAIKSLKNYPLPVHSGHGCIKLNYFGDHTCKKLDKKLTSFLKEHKLQRLTGPDPFTVTTVTSGSDHMRKGAKKKSSSKLSVNEEVASTDTVETISGAQLKQKPKRAPRKPKNVEAKPDSHQPSSDVITEVTATHSFGNNRSGSTSQQCLEPISTASSPIRSRCVVTSSSTTVLTLGGGGGFIARTASTSEIADRVPQQSAATRFKNIPFENYTMQPGTFNVVLCVDNQEIHGKGNISTKLDVIAELRKHNLDFDVRGLKVGDFLWIAREKAEYSVGRKPRELVLEFVAERKRGDDLAISIKDGRYTCQKFRMKMSGLRRLIYIIEDGQRFQQKGLKDGAFDQALTNLGIQDGFLVKETDSLRKTAEYLLTMTMYLQRNYTTKTLKSVPFSERCEKSDEDFNINQPTHGLLTYAAFSAVAKTNQTKNVSQAFLLQLLALDGVSPAKASAIVAKYPTLRRLLKAYDLLSSDHEKKIMLRDIKFGSGLTSLGPAISKRLFKLYCSNGPLR